METERVQKQFSFRLPREMARRLDACAAALARIGLDVTRTDVVRLLLNYALDATHGRLRILLERRPPPTSRRGA